VYDVKQAFPALKLKHGSASQAIYALRSAPMLEFDV